MNRMFVAVTPSPGSIEHLEAFLEPRREATTLRWTRADQWHLTLAFLENVPDRSYDDLLARLERAARKRTPMTAQIVGGGAFPHVGRAKVLWAGVALDDAEELHRLATGARAAASRAGVPVPGERFKPHLTLGRSRQPFEATRWVRLLDGYVGPAWPVEEFALIASYLGEGEGRRPRYEVLETFTLGTGA